MTDGTSKGGGCGCGEAGQANQGGRCCDPGPEGQQHAQQHGEGGSCCSQGGDRARRGPVTQADRIARLEQYLSDLRAEAAMVEERIAEMKAA